MPSPYLPNLVHIARNEMPQLKHDLDQASTLFTLQATCQRMHDVLTMLLHHVIMDSDRVRGAQVPIEAQPAAIPTQVAPTAYQPNLPSGLALPLSALTHVPQVMPATTRGPNLAPPRAFAPAPQQVQQTIAPSAVTEVVMTASGTQVIPPGGSTPALVLPPGEPVSTDLTQPQPQIHSTGGHGVPNAENFGSPSFEGTPSGEMSHEAVSVYGIPGQIAGARNITPPRAG